MDVTKQQVLLKKGAEANLYLTNWHGRTVVLKQRLAKEYRSRILDRQIRAYRTLHEPQLMNEARKAGVPTPVIFLIDSKNTTIIMEYVIGKQVKELLNSVSNNERQYMCFRMGELIGRLHEHSIVHGDLTTSNMIQRSEGSIVFLDFGLGEKTNELEAKGVDLHLMKRALQSTHYRFAEDCFSSAMKGYFTVLKSEKSENVIHKIKEIERRGRYVVKRKEIE